jgi:hypothetical protein
MEKLQQLAQTEGGQAVKRYKIEQLRVSGPIYGFLIHTPSGKTMRDIYPNTIAKELNRLNNRIKRLEEGLGCVVVSCNHLHHRKKHQHRSGEPCPVEELIRKAKEAK